MEAKLVKIIYRIFVSILVTMGVLIVVIIFLPCFIDLPTPEGRNRATKNQIMAISIILSNYNSEIGHYPSTSQGLKALYEKPTGFGGEKWDGPYTSKSEIPKDGWYRELHYQCPGAHNPESYDLWSYGKDGKPGGTGWNADIGNW